MVEGGDNQRLVHGRLGAAGAERGPARRGDCQPLPGADGHHARHHDPPRPGAQAQDQVAWDK